MTGSVSNSRRCISVKPLVQESQPKYLLFQIVRLQQTMLRQSHTMPRIEPSGIAGLKASESSLTANKHTFFAARIAFLAKIFALIAQYKPRQAPWISRCEGGQDSCHVTSNRRARIVAARSVHVDSTAHENPLASI